MRRFLLLALLLLNAPLATAQADLAPITPDNVADLEELAMLGGGVIDQVEWSPDGATIAVASSVGVWLYDAYDLDAPPRLLRHPARVYDIAFDPTGTKLASGAGDSSARLWDAASGEVIASFAHPGTDDYAPAVRAVAFSTDGSLLAYGIEADLHRVDLAATTEREPIEEGCAYSITALDFSPDGTLLACGTAAFGDYFRGNTAVFDAQTGELVSEAGENEPWVKQVQFNADGSSLLIEYDLDGQEEYFDRYRLWDVETGAYGEPLIRWEWWQAGKDALFSPSGSLVALSEGHSLVVRDVETGDETASLELEFPAITKAFNPNGSLVAFLRNYRLNIWSLETGAVISAATQHNAPFEAAAVSNDGRYVAAVDRVGRTFLWRVDDDGTQEIPLESVAEQMPIINPIQSLEALSVYNPFDDRVEPLLAFSPNNTYLAVIRQDGTLRLWLIDGGSLIPQGAELTLTEPRGLDFTSNESLVLLGCQVVMTAGGIQVSSEPSISTITMPCRDSGVSASSPDLTRTASASDTGVTVTADFGDSLVLDRDVDAPLSLVFSPGGERLAVGTDLWVRETLQLWELGSDRDSVILLDEADELRSIAFPSPAFSPDGSLLAAGTMRIGDAKLPIYLWDVSGSPPNPDADVILFGHTDTVSDVQFSANGTLLVSASYDGTVRLWGVGGES